MLPTTFVITLPFATPSRTERCRSHLESMQVRYKLFRGFDGKQLKVTTTQPMEVGDVGAASHGLSLSWYALVKFGLMMDLPEMLVFEDDVVLCDGFHEKFRQFRAELPADYLFGYLGYTNPLPDEFEGHLASGAFKQVSPNLVRGQPLGTHAVLLSREAMELIDAAAVLWTNIDCFFFWKIMIANPVRTYIAHPHQLARQLSADGVIPTMLKHGGDE